LNLRVQFSGFFRAEEGWIGLETGNLVKAVLIAFGCCELFAWKTQASLNISHVERARS
jgi:hypothetical protein